MIKTQSFKKLGASVALLLGLGAGGPAGAFTVLEDLAAGATRTDIVEFTCPVGTVEARGYIHDFQPPNALPLVRLGLFKDGLMSVVAAPQESVSGVVVRAGGPGNYLAMMMKNGFGQETYYAVIDCYNAFGMPLPAPFILPPTQDQ